jgi:hypothetical protein
VTGWWQLCGCGCATWHQFEECGPIDSRHTADLGGEAVVWVMNPAERCGECLLAADEVSTSRERKALATIQADFVDFLDAGIRLIEPSDS